MAFHFENVKLEKGMYNQAGMSFTDVLEKADPSENYRGTALEGLDAYQRQLKRFDIKVKGAGSDIVEKFFRTTESSVLFPEYVARSVRAGMEEGSVLSSIVASTTKFEGMDYRSIYSAATEDDKTLRRVEEGTAIPTTEIKVQSNLVKLHKRGRMLVASYEAIRFQRLDLFSVMLRQIGSHIMRMHLEDAVDVLVNGDGNSNAAAAYAIGTSPITGTSGTLTYSALLDFWAQFEPYNMNTIIVPPAVMLQLLNLSVFQDAAAGLNFQGTGQLISPLGAKLISTSAAPSGKIIGVDNRYALEMVQVADVNVEYDRLIDRQLERAAITSIYGFAKLYKEAACVLTV